MSKSKEAPTEDKKLQGGQTVYTKEKADFVLSELAEGRSLRRLCDSEQGQAFDPPLKPSTIRNWVLDDVEGFAAQYTRARDIGLDAMADDLFDIADDGSNDLMTIEKGDITYEIENKEVTNRSKLRVETRKWYLSKLAPKRYGEKLDIKHSGDPDNPISTTHVYLPANGRETKPVDASGKLPQHSGKKRVS